MALRALKREWSTLVIGASARARKSRLSISRLKRAYSSRLDSSTRRYCSGVRTCDSATPASPRNLLEGLAQCGGEAGESLEEPLKGPLQTVQLFADLGRQPHHPPRPAGGGDS